MTPAQTAAYGVLTARWPRVSAPKWQRRDRSVLVECFYPGALGSKWIAIKPDGTLASR